MKLRFKDKKRSIVWRITEPVTTIAKIQFGLVVKVPGYRLGGAQFKSRIRPRAIWASVAIPALRLRKQKRRKPFLKILAKEIAEKAVQPVPSCQV